MDRTKTAGLGWGSRLAAEGPAWSPKAGIHFQSNAWSGMGTMLGAGSVSHRNLESPPAISSPSPHLAATSRTTSRTVQADEVAALRVRFSAGRPQEIKHDFWHIRPLWSFEAFEHKNVILLIHRWSIGDRKGHDRLLRAATIKQPDVRRKRPRWCMYEICTYAQATGVVLCLTVDGE